MQKGIPGVVLENGYNEQANRFWSIYVSETEQHDSNITGTWKADLDSTLIFAGLFSATVTAFIIDSYKLLQQDSADVTNALLIELLAGQIATTRTNSSVVPPSTLPTFDKFMPSAQVVAINILWFLSLACSLAAALCITLIQKWVRDYLQRIQRHNQPLRRARVRTFLFNGSQRWKMDAIVGYITTLLHVALLLFFAGLCVFLFEINIPVFCAVTVVVLLWLAFYGLATLAPLLDPSTPCETPLTALFWSLLQQFGAYLSYRYSAQRYQDGSFRPSVASVDLTKAREQLALNPVTGKSSVGSLLRDVQALIWTHDRITDERELESFIRSIPGFLLSVDGRRTWAAAFHQLSSSLENRITDLLSSCSKASYMEPHVRRTRATICIEALAAISQEAARNQPCRPPEHLTIPELSRCLMWNDDMPVSSGIHTIALLSRQYLVSKFTPSAIPRRVLELSAKADAALKDMDDMRHTLERVLDELASNPQDYREDVGHLLQTYFRIVEVKTQDLLTWVNDIGPILYEYDQFRQHGLLSWYALLPDVRHSVRYRDILALGSGSCGLELYPHQVSAFMRAIGAYPELDMSQSPQAPSALSPSWFPNVPLRTQTNELRYLRRELEPVSLLLNYLEPNPTLHQVEVRSKKPEAQSNARPRVPYPDYKPILTDHLGPFSTIAFILEDIRHSATVLPLLGFVAELKYFKPASIEMSVIREILDQIFPRPFVPLREPSEILFVAILRVILDWERDASPDKPCPFSFSDVTFLIGLLKTKLSSNKGLETAERLFGTSLAPEVEGVYGRNDQASQLQLIDFDQRTLAVHNYIVSRRSMPRQA
ncbi:hypothetical protein C0995_001146 [Termitomyces sp. Mi166|nr:hypothetical protein C0995_001146 [Termitomyces sp. Mi166\